MGLAGGGGLGGLCNRVQFDCHDGLYIPVM